MTKTLKGTEYFCQQKYKMALECHEQSLEMDASNWIAMLNLGTASMFADEGK